jgi:hypothetical protein
MMPTQEQVHHTGEERYEVVLTYTDDQVAEVAKLTRDGQIVVDTVYLVYTRRVGESWQRYTNGRYGSRAEGHEKIENGRGAVGPRRSRQVFTSTLGEVCTWTQHLPGLRLAIEDVESKRPA